MIRSIRNSFRKKKKPKATTESATPAEWQQDEKTVQSGNCKFHVKYLGCIEVQDSRGMQVCEGAVKQLKSHKKKKIKAILYVSPDALRVVEDSSKALLLDQTIEKVSFCAPDRNYDRAFSYICRDGTTRRWICHSFFAIRDTGERLSHAVGCAFAACLEKKQKRERDAIGVTARYENNKTMFTREGSFRPKMQTEIDNESRSPSSTPSLKHTTEIPADVHNSAAVPRPHAPAHLVRQASLRNFSNKKKFMEGDLNSPFKRNLSLRVNELPSTISRQQIMNPVPEDERESEGFPQSNTFSNGDDPFTQAPPISRPAPPNELRGLLHRNGQNGGIFPLNQSESAVTSSPVRETNPWASEVTQQGASPFHRRTPSQADQWLSGVESQARTQTLTNQPALYNPMMPQVGQGMFLTQSGYQPMGYNQIPMTQPHFQQSYSAPQNPQIYQQQQNAFRVNM